LLGRKVSDIDRVSEDRGAHSKSRPIWQANRLPVFLRERERIKMLSRRDKTD